MSERVSFEDLLDAVDAACRRALAALVPEGEARPPAWIGLVFEQEKLYAGCAFDAGRDDVTRFDFLIGSDDNRRLWDLFSAFQDIPAADGVDLDDEDTRDLWGETCNEFAHLAMLTALALAALRLDAPTVTIGNDIESPTYPARVPRVTLDDDGDRDALLATCDRPANRALLARLLALGGPDAPALLDAVRG